jgi:hypothetical protein
MKKILAALVLSAMTGIGSAYAFDPIPGSITYNGQPATHLEKAPVGSTFTNRFVSTDSKQYEESYMVLPDRSLKLIGRVDVTGGDH